jgi:hypothetical protein
MQKLAADLCECRWPSNPIGGEIYNVEEKTQPGKVQLLNKNVRYKVLIALTANLYLI